MFEKRETLINNNNLYSNSIYSSLNDYLNNPENRISKPCIQEVIIYFNFFKDLNKNDIKIYILLNWFYF